MDLLFLLSAVSEVIAGIFFIARRRLSKTIDKSLKQFSAGREQEKIQIASSAVMVY